MFIEPSEMPLLCLSQDKINAVEDCILFFPTLFKLNKSIIVSETLDSRSAGQDLIGKSLGKEDSILNTSAEQQEERYNTKARSIMRVMTSKKLKQLIIQRDTLKGDKYDSEWLQTINEKKEEARK